MKTLYIDCTSGISGDMLAEALYKLTEPKMEVEGQDQSHAHDHSQSHAHDHSRSHPHDHNKSHAHGHRSYGDVRKIIEKSEKTQRAKDIALRIYEVIAKAETKVHGMTLDTLHFHEVGRDVAITNALKIGESLEKLGFARSQLLAGEARIIVSPICDGSGFVDCAHGRIPVPVPAVQAIMDECGRAYPDFEFRQLDEVKTEMVTPSGLAALVGIGAGPSHGVSGEGQVGEPDAGHFMDLGGGMVFMEGQITGMAEVKGTRDTGRGGLRVYLIER
ncbi:MAG: DUF111 family protein [Eubacteriales bacterium]|nr:DUF111 family protein [Eubacteriales bacterium]